MCQDSHGGDKEFVVACKNRPFAMLTSSNYPTPEVNFIDHKLVSELKLKMSELQSCKLHFGSQKLRIPGKVSTSVQCITNGMVCGNLHFKATVVENLYEKFDSHSIVCAKLNQLLLQPANSTTPEPQTPLKSVKKRKRARVATSSTSTNYSVGDEDTLAECSDDSSTEYPQCGFDMLQKLGRLLLCQPLCRNVMPFKEKHAVQLLLLQEEHPLLRQSPHLLL